MATAAAIKATLGLDTGQLSKDLRRADSLVTRFGKGIKFAFGGFFAFTGINAIANSIRTMAQFAEELNPKLKKSAEAMAALRQEASGLSDDQLEKLSDVGTAFDRLTARVKGYVAALIIAAFEARQFTDEEALDIAQGGTGGFFSKFKKSFEENKPNPAKAKADADARQAQAEADRAAKEAEERTSRALEEQVKQYKLSGDEEFRMSDLAGKRAILEREIAELKAAQNSDDFLTREQAKTKELEKQQSLRKLEVDALLKPADQRREEERQRAKEERAGRVLDARKRDATDTALRNAPQLLKKQPGAPGELQGPPAPVEDKAVTVLVKINTALNSIDQKLGVNV